MEEVKLNSNCVNAKIVAHILPEKEMREIGFTNCYEPIWYFFQVIKFPKEKRYRGFNISFSVSIPKDGSDIRIDVLDEDFCQPMDYQYILSKNCNHDISLIIKTQVEKFMEYLQEKGVLSGHIYGEYI